MNLPKQKEHAEVYAPYVEAFETATKKRHIHKCQLYTSNSSPDSYGLFLQVKVTPHRSKGGVALIFLFTTSDRVGVEKPMIRVEVETWSKDYECSAGAVADVMMLIAELTNAWTTLAEGAV